MTRYVMVLACWFLACRLSVGAYSLTAFVSSGASLDFWGIYLPLAIACECVIALAKAGKGPIKQ